MSKHAPRRYVLAGGLSVCGACGAAMGGTVKTSPAGKRRAYLVCAPGRGAHQVCAPGRGGRSCVGILFEPTEQHVVGELFAALDRPEFLAAVTEDDHTQRRDELARALSAIDTQRTELAGMWSGGGMSTSEWQAARSGLDKREQTLRAELAAIPAPMSRIDTSDVRAAWPAMTLDERHRAAADVHRADHNPQGQARYPVVQPGTGEH